jgi:hypothetical protein
VARGSNPRRKGLGIILRGSNLRINAGFAISHFVQSADWIKVAAFRAFNLETRNSGITAKGSNPNREPLRFVDDKESLPAYFVSYWSDCHGVFCGLIFSRDFPRLAKYIAGGVPTSHKAFARCEINDLSQILHSTSHAKMQTPQTQHHTEMAISSGRQDLPGKVCRFPCKSCLAFCKAR